MSVKENAAVNQLLELLEARYALRVLWALRDGHPQTFRLLQDSIGSITPNTLNTRIKDLREAGLIHHVATGYTVTPMGQDLLRRLSEMQAFAGKWAASQSRSAAGTSAGSGRAGTASRGKAPSASGQPSAPVAGTAPNGATTPGPTAPPA